MDFLAMRDRAEMVGGKFTVEATAGKGTTVEGRIPLRQAIRSTK